MCCRHAILLLTAHGTIPSDDSSAATHVPSAEDDDAATAQANQPFDSPSGGESVEPRETTPSWPYENPTDKENSKFQYIGVGERQQSLPPEPASPPIRSPITGVEATRIPSSSLRMASDGEAPVSRSQRSLTTPPARTTLVLPDAWIREPQSAQGSDRQEQKAAQHAGRGRYRGADRVPPRMPELSCGGELESSSFRGASVPVDNAWLSARSENRRRGDGTACRLGAEAKAGVAVEVTSPRPKRAFRVLKTSRDFAQTMRRVYKVRNTESLSDFRSRAWFHVGFRGAQSFYEIVPYFKGGGRRELEPRRVIMSRRNVLRGPGKTAPGGTIARTLHDNVPRPLRSLHT